MPEEIFFFDVHNTVRLETFIFFIALVLVDNGTEFGIVSSKYET